MQHTQKLEEFSISFIAFGLLVSGSISDCSVYNPKQDLRVIVRAVAQCDRDHETKRAAADALKHEFCDELPCTSKDRYAFNLQNRAYNSRDEKTRTLSIGRLRRIVSQLQLLQRKSCLRLILLKPVTNS